MMLLSIDFIRNILILQTQGSTTTNDDHYNLEHPIIVDLDYITRFSERELPFICIEHDISVVSAMIELNVLKHDIKQDDEKVKSITIDYDRKIILYGDTHIGFDMLNKYVKSLILNLPQKITWTRNES